MQTHLTKACNLGGQSFWVERTSLKVSKCQQLTLNNPIRGWTNKNAWQHKKRLQEGELKQYFDASPPRWGGWVSRCWWYGAVLSWLRLKCLCRCRQVGFFSLILLVGSLFLCSGQRYCCQNEKQGSRSLLQCDQPEGLQGDLLIVIIS